MERVREAVTCCNSQLKQAKNEKAKLLISCCNGVHKKLKTKKALTPGPFSPWKSILVESQMDQCRYGDHPPVEGALNTRLWQFYELWSLSGKARSGKVLVTI